MRALVAVDLRTEPANVVASAAPWLARFGAVADSVYVDPYRDALERYLPWSVRGELQAMIAEDEALLAKLLEGLPGANRGRAFVVGGLPGEAIARLGADYDLVVSTTHGRTGIAHAWLGSVAERFVRVAPCSVLVVRNPPPTAGATRVLAAVALEENVPRPTPAQVIRWAGADARVDLLHVEEALGPVPSAIPGLVGTQAIEIILAEGDRLRALAREAMISLRDEALPAAIRGQAYVDLGPPAHAILARAEAYDLVVVGTHGRQGLDRLFLGSVAERVVQRSPRSVLVVR